MGTDDADHLLEGNAGLIAVDCGRHDLRTRDALRAKVEQRQGSTERRLAVAAGDEGEDGLDATRTVRPGVAIDPAD